MTIFYELLQMASLTPSTPCQKKTFKTRVFNLIFLLNKNKNRETVVLQNIALFLADLFFEEFILRYTSFGYHQNVTFCFLVFPYYWISNALFSFSLV